MLGGCPPQARRVVTVRRKQERLLYLAFYLLLNLAEDVGTERKMKKRNVVLYLALTLECDSVELLLLAVTFLKVRREGGRGGGSSATR